MKKLQDAFEERWEFQALAVMDGAIRKVENPDQVILLLHGLNERGRRIFRKLMAYLPSNALILAPNGPYPLPRMNENKIQYGFTWYFFDKFQSNYFINQDLARSWLKQLLALKNPQRLPLNIIGFSQGGYLAPLVGQDHPETNLVLGLGCEFRSHLIQDPVHFRLEGLHGVDDTVITPESSLFEVEQIRKRGIPCGWESIEGTGHEISPLMGERIKTLLEEYGKRSL